MLRRLGVSAARLAASPLANGAMLARAASSGAQTTGSIQRLLENNRKWRGEKQLLDPDYFTKTAKGQQPQVLWIGCSDSRVPAELLTGLDAGEVFVMRNIANLVNATDMSALSVLQYGVQHLKVKDIVVCGHTKCGGVAAALANQQLGLIDSWLQNIRDVCRLHDHDLAGIKDADARLNRVIELNTIEQCLNILKINFVQEHQEKYGFPRVHALLYDLTKGELKELDINVQEYAHEYDATYHLHHGDHGEAFDRNTQQGKAIRVFGKGAKTMKVKDVERELKANPILFSKTEIAAAIAHLKNGSGDAATIDVEKLAAYFESQ